ncbi:FAD-dependent urate hydroxylase HpxO [Acinetobacter larvae]|uniref:FAD-dependent urate hydroxylase n=1 Tax=Acinetobacter larvae TaxID=1789224 RepID=A0A1B2LZ84_9GAMM|nr:FAD-dependent urate hydroxylase HpxO [Acinetobacter larvae]AOA58083.1 monooxygenase [Acinetobacter larvae]
MNIAIIGAGIGGLTAGIALKKFGHQVTIYEQAAEILAVGAAISLWSNGVKCLNYLGLTEKIQSLGGQMDSLAYIDGLNQQTMTQFSLAPLYQEVGQRAYPVARSDLQQLLMAEFGHEQIVLNKRMIQLQQYPQHVSIRFQDGDHSTADLVIGADGTHSITRLHVLGENRQRRYAGYVNWNGLIAIDEHIAPAQQWTSYVGEGKRVSLMPVAGDRFYVFFDIPLAAGLMHDPAQYGNVLQQHFSHWCVPVQRLINCLDPQHLNRVEIHDIEPFMTFYRGRVVLLGDAAHSTTPDIGQGGCQAMEDAIYLARSLQINTLGLEDALRRYQNKRNQRCKELLLRARKRCDITHMKDRQLTEHWYQTLYSEQGSHIMQGILNNILGNPLD